MVEFTTVALGLFVTLEFGYFIKTFVCAIGSRFILPKAHLFAPCRLYGICTTRDIDFMLNHINNARFLRAMDFGRVDHFTRTTLYKALGSQHAKALVAASTIRYRKPVYLFMPYKLESQIVYWDDKSLYYRQNFETVHDNFLRATAYVKVAVVGSTPENLFKQILSESPERLEAPEDLQSWMKFIQQSSDSLKKIQ